MIHLASAVSGECEQRLGARIESQSRDRDRAWTVCWPTCQQSHYLFFKFSGHLWGDCGFPLPDVITDRRGPNPQNSYGSQKLMLETFYADLARRSSIRPNTPLNDGLSQTGQTEPSGQWISIWHDSRATLWSASNVPVPLDTQVALNSPEQAVMG